jgi:hypothetical protein
MQTFDSSLLRHVVLGHSCGSGGGGGVGGGGGTFMPSLHMT